MRPTDRVSTGVPGIWAVYFAALVSTACSTIDAYVQNWPQDMKVTVHKNTGFWEVQRRCWAHMPLWRKALGSVCTQVAELNLDANTCDVYTMNNNASDHELAHCKGGDHDGALQRYFDTWRRTNQTTAAAPPPAQPTDTDPTRLVRR